jgi:hypothetical protein
MGDWDWNANWSGAALERIVALLFALADLADLAAGAPFFRRRQVLGILSRGEAEARAFVIGMVPGETAPVDAPGDAGDAAFLAARFRALALLLYAMLARRFAPGAAGPHDGQAVHRISGPATRHQDTPSPPAPDTS